MAAQEFTPAGGMNQDDSIITPTPNMAGKNAFELGDYRYALNARIGSSRNDNFNDLETIKGTTEVTTYKVRGDIATNSDFSSGLTGWSQTGSGAAWVVNFGVRYSGAEGATTSAILYQAVSPETRRVGIRVKIEIESFTNTSSFQIVFLSGTTVISTITIVTKVGTTNQIFDKYINVDIPDDCDGIGVQGYSTSLSSIGSSTEIKIFSIYNWTTGVRPSGTEKVIGKKEDREVNRLYYFVYNSNDDHCIRYYDPVANAVYEVLKWDLGFTETDFISSAIIDNYLGFTERNNNSPRLIDVNSMSDLLLILGSNFREYHISFHRWGPTMPPVLKAYYDEVTNNYKKFENKVFQFSYRYIFYDNTKSRFSPISVAAQNFLGDSDDPSIDNSDNEITAIELQIPGFTLDNPGAATQYNFFNNDSIKFTVFVKYVEIVYRESSTDLWRILKRHEVKESNNGTFYYEADADSTPISTSDFFQLFDTVPLRAGCIEAIDNRFMFGDIMDEEDQAMTPQVTSVGVVEFGITDTIKYWWNVGYSDAVVNADRYSGMSAIDANELGQRVRISKTTFKGRGIYKLGIQWLAKTGWRSAVYTAENWRYEIEPEAAIPEEGIIDKFYAFEWIFPSSFRPPKWAVAYQIMRTNVLNIDYFLFGSANAFTPLIDDSTAVSDADSVDQETRDRIRQHIENARTVAGLTNQLGSVLLDKNFYRSLSSQVRKTISSEIAVTAASRIYININNWYNGSSSNEEGTVNNPMNNLFYNYREGDRVRFIGSTNAAPSFEQRVIYDTLILEFTGRGIVIEKPIGIAWIPIDSSLANVRDWMIEVYTPKTPSGSNDYLYHETGEWYPVLYPGTDDRDMAKRDWTYTENASITCQTYGDIKVFVNRPFSYGDCHGIIKRFYSDYKAFGAFVSGFNSNTISMNPNPDEMWGAWEKCIGRSAPAYTDLPVAKFKPTQIRFGGQIIEESFVNQLTRFRDEDQKIYPSEYGRIRTMINTANAQVESVGAILLVIGERETYSIYINRTTLEDLSGRSQVALSERVLGSYNTLLGSHGTLNPESVSTDRGRVYFWDAIDGTWIRYGRDGLTEISFYKMRNWFRELGELLIDTYASTPPSVLSEFDPYNEELITMINHSSLPATFRGYATYKGVMFSEEDRRWKSVHSYLPEMIGKINNQVVEFVGGNVILLETSETRSTFNGTKYDVMIEPVFNISPKDMKSWQNIAVIATHGWSVERFLSEYRGAKTKQQSRIPLTSFEQKEDVYFAAIPNDVNTPVVQNPIINGDKMRSKAIRTLLKLDPSVVSESLLHYVVINGIDSPKNA